MFARLMGLKTVSPAALSRLTQAGEPIAVIDVNSRQSWLKARVPGARNARWVEFTQDELPSDKTAFLVFYCSNMLCRKAPNAARRAAQMGYQNVHVMSAGINGWVSEGLVTESG